MRPTPREFHVAPGGVRDDDFQRVRGLLGLGAIEHIQPRDHFLETEVSRAWRETSRQAWGFFERANPTVFAELKKLFPPLESDGSTLQAVGKLRGDWTYTTKAQDGSAFEIRKGDTNFMPMLAETKVHPEHLEATYESLCPIFQKISL